MSAEVAVADFNSEICVIGAGPAGSVIARRLAQLGYDMVLVDRGRRENDPRAESLAPSILSILDSVGLRDRVEAAIFRRERYALLLWGRGTIEENRFVAEPSLLIERTRLDEVLRELAVSASVRLIAPATARAASHLVAGGWWVPLDTPKGSMAVPLGAAH